MFSMKYNHNEYLYITLVLYHLRDDTQKMCVKCAKAADLFCAKKKSCDKKNHTVVVISRSTSVKLLKTL